MTSALDAPPITAPRPAPFVLGPYLGSFLLAKGQLELLAQGLWPDLPPEELTA